MMPVVAADGSAAVFTALRPSMLARLLAVRANLDPSLARLDDATARAQINAVLDHFANHLATGDAGLQRAFLHTFLAMRAAEAQSPASVLAMLVAIGDTAAQLAQDSGREGSAQLSLRLARVNASCARVVNDLIAEELERRLEQRAELAARSTGTVVTS